jgi:hypothetical protein
MTVAIAFISGYPTTAATGRRARTAAHATSTTSTLGLANTVDADAIGAWRAVRFGRVIAHAARRIALTRLVTFVLNRAFHGFVASACAGLARILLGTTILVVASFAVGFRRVIAHTRCGIARADIVALIRSHADDEIGTRANACFARARFRAHIAVIAR